MTKQEKLERAHQDRNLAALGLTPQDILQLRRDSQRLQRWAEMECNYDVQRDARSKVTVSDGTRKWNTPDRETPAIKRCQDLADRLGLVWHHQTDPRGCAVYIGQAATLKGQPIEQVYNRLIAVY